MRSKLFDVVLNNEVMTTPSADKIHRCFRTIIQDHALPLCLQFRLQYHHDWLSVSYTSLLCNADQVALTEIAISSSNERSQR